MLAGLGLAMALLLNQLADPSELAPAAMASLSPEPFMVYCPQSRSEPILRAAAEKRGGDACGCPHRTQMQDVSHEVIALASRGGS